MHFLLSRASWIPLLQMVYMGYVTPMLLIMARYVHF